MAALRGGLEKRDDGGSAQVVGGHPLNISQCGLESGYAKGLTSLYTPLSARRFPSEQTN